MNKKILIIEKTGHLGLFLKDKMHNFKIDVRSVKTGIDGLIKMRNELPDVMILDYNLYKMNINDFLREKSLLKTTKDIPIILLYSKFNHFNKQTILNLSKHKLFKLILKPVEIDQVLNALENILNKKLDIDLTECDLEAHLNHDYLIIDLSKGINKDKVELIKYKIFDFMQQNFIKIVIMIFSNIKQEYLLTEKIDLFMMTLIASLKININDIYIMTNITHIKNYFLNHEKFKHLMLFTDVKTISNKLGESNSNMNKFFIDDKSIKSFNDSNINSMINNGLELDKKKLISMMKQSNETFKIAVIDDDIRILEFIEILLSKKNYAVKCYVDGTHFIDSLKKNKPDLIFLDPAPGAMIGFEILEYLHIKSIDIPVVIISALFNKDMLQRAKKLGVTNFFVKPLKSELILKKIEEFKIKKIYYNQEVSMAFYNTNMTASGKYNLNI